MSKSTAIKTSSNNAKTLSTKQREPSKDRTSLRKGNVALSDCSNVSSVSVKTKPSTTAKPLPANKTSVKKVTKGDLHTTDTHIKTDMESSRRKVTATNKSLSTASKTSTAASKTSTVQQSTSIKKKSTAPETPPSNRVTKTQYFPTKNLYSNVVQTHLKSKASKQNNSGSDTAGTSNTERSRTRTLDRNEIKIVKDKGEATAKTIEKPQVPREEDKVRHNDIKRPGTATLRKGSIVNSNIAGPDIPKSETPSLTSLDLNYEQDVEREGEDIYEDDFDSYESDFEAYESSESTSMTSSEDVNILEEEDTTSDEPSSPVQSPKQNTSAGTDEERMLDSGHFDMSENKHKQLLNNIKECAEKEQFGTELRENNQSNMASLSDEGFEDGKSGVHSGNTQFINFLEAQRKLKHNKNLEKRRKRGEEILNMIRLDHYNFTLIDIPPVPYDVFIRNYGKTNTVQVPTQTGHDDLSEEIQTDTVETTSKWTQCPVTFSKIENADSNYMMIYKQEYVGVGNDSITESYTFTKEKHVNTKRLEQFISFAGQIVLVLLEETLNSITKRKEQNSREIPFSSGYVKFETNLNEFLNNRPVTFVSYYSTTSIKILTVHGRNTKDCEHMEIDNSNSLKSIACIWSILNLEKPEKILTVTGELNCCCSISETKNLIFGGLYDGSLVIWDLNENKWLREDSNSTEKTYFQIPSYTTDIDCGHACKIVSVHLVSDTTDSFVHSSVEWKSPDDQICSLDENGILIIWGIIVRKSSSHSAINNHSVGPWCQFAMVPNSKLSLQDLVPDIANLLCTDMNISAMDRNHLFISTNYGCVIHCLATGAKANPRRHSPATISQANCLESCTFSPLYFFAGYEDGSVALYSRLLEKPLMVMSNKEDALQSGIYLLQWSYHRPCMFYAKDHCNTIHMWDLAVSDLYPVYSVPFKENITCMKLSPPLIKSNDSSYMILATESGSIHLHVLNPEHGPSGAEQYQQDVQKFLSYVSRL